MNSSAKSPTNHRWAKPNDIWNQDKRAYQRPVEGYWIRKQKVWTRLVWKRRLQRSRYIFKTHWQNCTETAQIATRYNTWWNPSWFPPFSGRETASDAWGQPGDQPIHLRPKNQIWALFWVHGTYLYSNWSSWTADFKNYGVQLNFFRSYGRKTVCGCITMPKININHSHCWHNVSMWCHKVYLDKIPTKNGHLLSHCQKKHVSIS